MEHSHQRSWFARNWGWVLPVGCCSGCLIMIVISFLGLGTFAFSIFNEMKEMSPLEEVLVTVNESEMAKEILGENIKSIGFPNGNISVNNDDGEVKFSIDLEGTKGKGVLYVNGIRVAKKWSYEDLYIIIRETAEEINLLEKNRSIN